MKGNFEILVSMNFRIPRKPCGSQIHTHQINLERYDVNVLRLLDLTDVVNKIISCIIVTLKVLLHECFRSLTESPALNLSRNRKCDSVPPVAGICLKRCREQGLLVILGNVFALNDNVEVPKMRDDLMQTTYAMNHWELQS